MEEKELKILCPFCDQIWDAKMKAEYSSSMGSEWTGEYDQNISVEIHCSNCKRLVYAKNDYPEYFNEED